MDKGAKYETKGELTVNVTDVLGGEQLRNRVWGRLDGRDETKRSGGVTANATKMADCHHRVANC